MMTMSIAVAVALNDASLLVLADNARICRCCRWNQAIFLTTESETGRC